MGFRVISEQKNIFLTFYDGLPKPVFLRIFTLVNPYLGPFWAPFGALFTSDFRVKRQVPQLHMVPRGTESAGFFPGHMSL